MISESASLRDLELNEANWWGLWSDLRWLSKDSYAILSSDFDEYFFNRAGFLGCDDSNATLAAVECAFKASKRTPCFCVPETCTRLTESLMTRGYDTFDTMAVMRLGNPGFKIATTLSIASGEKVDSDEWATTYSLSFYGNLRMGPRISKIVSRLRKESAVTLMVGKRDGRTTGALAAFRTPGILGVYCVGTLKEHRMLGVAGSLLAEASRFASAEGRELIIQTIASEGATKFYLNGGFSTVYSKLLMMRGMPEGDQAGRA